MALKVLSALDSSRTQYYHFKAIIVAGMGLFTDAYDFFCFPAIMKLLESIYYEHDHLQKTTYDMPTTVMLFMLCTALLGTAIGQVIFGRQGDRKGRRSVYGLALMLMVISSLGCGFSICRTRRCVLLSLGFFRFFLGLGIGGDYPLSATIMSEFANKRTRGSFVAGVFSMQGFGILASSAVTMVVCRIFWGATHNLTNEHTPQAADITWRLILMLGAIPAALTYYWRMMMPETARYTALVENNVLQAAKDMEKVLDVPMSQIAEDEPLSDGRQTYPLFSRQFFRRHGRDLLACSINWFLIDIVFYSSNLFQSQIYIQFLKLDEDNVYKEAFKVARFQAILAICSTIPGYYFSVYFIDRIGRRKLQIMGFLLMGIVYIFGLGLPYKHWRSNTNVAFLFLYALTFFFANFGPNTTTFIVPAELFPARFRSTCHGIAGAVGKMGALIGTIGVLYASKQHDGNGFLKAKPMTSGLVVLGIVCLIGAVVTYLFTPETNGRSLEENENENEYEYEYEGNHQSFFRCLTASVVAR